MSNNNNTTTYFLCCSCEGDVLVVLGQGGTTLASGLLSDDNPITGSLTVRPANDVGALIFAIDDGLQIGSGYSLQASLIDSDGREDPWGLTPPRSSLGLARLVSPLISRFHGEAHQLQRKIRLELVPNEQHPGSTAKRPPIKTVIIETQISWAHVAGQSSHTVVL